MNTELIRKTESLADYGNRSEIREMFSRIKEMIPGAANAPDGVVLAAAQKAIAHDLDLFDDEMYIMQIGGRWMAHVGIKGLRRNAGDQHYFEDSDDYPRRLSDDELREDLGNFKQGTVGIEVRLYNIAKAKEAKVAGIPYFPRRERGYWTPDESIPHTRSSAWVAQKRAEKVALRAEFSLKWRERDGREALQMLERKDQQRQRETALPVQRQIEREPDGNILFPGSQSNGNGHSALSTEAPEDIEEGEYVSLEDEPEPDLAMDEIIATWRGPLDAQQWSIEIGACDGEENARGAWIKATKAVTGKSSATVKQLSSIYEWFYNDRCEKLQLNTVAPEAA